MKPLIEIIDTTNEPNIIEQILIGGSNAPITKTPYGINPISNFHNRHANMGGNITT